MVPFKVRLFGENTDSDNEPLIDSDIDNFEQISGSF